MHDVADHGMGHGDRRACSRCQFGSRSRGLAESDPALAHAEWQGKPITIGSGDLSVTLHSEPSSDYKTCNPGNGTRQPGQICIPLFATVQHGGNGAYSTVVTLTDWAAGDPFRLQATADIRRLDSASAEPQVVLSSYTGGAHCCTNQIILQLI